MLEAHDLTLAYGGSTILDGVAFEARLGEVTAVMGLNGVGKTSLLAALAGRHPSGGRAMLDGKVLSDGARARARAGVAYVPQGREIFPLLTVAENLETGFACLPRAERQVPDAIFDLFPVLAQMRGRRGGDLSGGQQQQLAIARALVTRPRVLLLDEPTEGIQPSVVTEIGTVIRRLRAGGDMAIVLVEQRFDFAWGLADRVVAMRGGVVVHDRPRELSDRDEVLSLVSV
ncbi:MAG: urea ABC transporter ATP-binding subunit UrtE [Pseudomonadota bacterium]